MKSANTVVSFVAAISVSFADSEFFVSNWSERRTDKLVKYVLAPVYHFTIWRLTDRSYSISKEV